MDKVTLFEGSESGAAAVKYKGAEAPEAAQRCVAMMSGRSFGGSLIKAELYDGVSDYRAKAVREASAGGGGLASPPRSRRRSLRALRRHVSHS